MMVAMKAFLCLLAVGVAAGASIPDLPIASKGPTVPEQIHINLANPSNDAVHSFSVAWATTADLNTVVKYGDSPDKLNRQVTGSSSTYTRAASYGHLDYTSPHLHKALLQNLPAERTVYYQVGDPAVQMSAVLSFKTPPKVGSHPNKNQPYEIAVLADLGQTADSLSTVNHVLQDTNALLVLQAGDLAYADCDQPRWDSFNRLIEPMTSKLPYMLCGGNHDNEIDPTNGRSFVSFEARYHMPEIKPAEFDTAQNLALISGLNPPPCVPSSWLGTYDYGNSFYSFEVATIHIIVLQTFTASGEGSKQNNWLKSDLASVNRKKTPWVIVMFHSPFYNSNFNHQPHNEQSTVNFQAGMEKLFYDNHVAMAFAGHVHGYERTNPMFDFASIEGGVTYVTIGDAGNREGHAGPWLLPTPEWSVHRDNTSFGHGLLRVLDNEKAQWEWHSNDAGTETMNIGDSFTVINPYKAYEH